MASTLGLSYRIGIGPHCYYIIKSCLAISSPDEFLENLMKSLCVWLTSNYIEPADIAMFFCVTNAASLLHMIALYKLQKLDGHAPRRRSTARHCL